MNTDKNFRCGYVVLMGRPNVGKSTLMNQLLGQKISITSKRPQTTRNRLLGIKTETHHQIIFVDTPGIHKPGKRLLNKIINRTALSSTLGADCIVMLISAKGWSPEDEGVLNHVLDGEAPVIIVINKLDLLKASEDVLPLIKLISDKAKDNIKEIIPISALSGTNVDRLEEVIMQYLPVRPRLFPEDQITDQSERFLVSEMLREQVFRLIGQEVPYSVALEVENWEKKGRTLHIGATFWVEKESQKGIIIGKKGATLKKMGSRARQEIETILKQKVYLELWVKVRSDWRNKEAMLSKLGIQG